MSLAKHKQVSIITPFIMAGATSPITMASALAQQNAEALGAIAFTQLVNPGAPVIYGSFAQNIDMRSGSPSFGAPEGAWGMLVGAQLARRYNLPYRSSGSLTNSQIPDAQAAYESQWSMWPSMLAQANFVLHSVGWLEGGLVASYEKFMIDTETIGMFYHFLNSFDVDASSLALEDIAQVGIGGHHLDSSRTQANFRTAFYDPALSSRDNYELWESKGSKTTLERAHDLYLKVLDSYEAHPP